MAIQPGDWALALCRNPLTDAELERHVAYGGGYWFLDAGWIRGHDRNPDLRTYRVHNSCLTTEVVLARPSDRWDALGGAIKPWRRHGKHILLLGASGSQNEYCTQQKRPLWVPETVQRIRQLTLRPIVYRPKPGVPGVEKPDQALEVLPKLGVTLSTNKRLETDLEDAWIVVGLRGTGLLQALFFGVPVTILHDFEGKGWSTPLHEVETPRRLPREPLAYDLAYREFSLAEIENGRPFQC